MFFEPLSCETRRKKSPAKKIKMAETKSETKPSEQHKLNKAWSLWYKGIAGGGKGNADDWDCGTLAYTFDTAENFWSMYNNVTAPSKVLYAHVSNRCHPDANFKCFFVF